MQGLFHPFRTDPAFRAQVRRYNRRDGWCAVLLFLLVMALYYAAGLLMRWRNLYVGVPMNLLLTAACVALALGRGGTLASLGITVRNAGKSALLGLLSGLLFLLLSSLLPGLRAGRALAPLGALIGKLLYYFFVIALMEEVVFRGYILTRIQGLVGSGWAATVLSGAMFVLMHIPFQMGQAGMGLIEFCKGNLFWFLLLFLWHLVFTLLYRRYANLLAPTIFHALMDFGNALFMA